MKKSIALVAMSFGVSSIFAQDLTSKKGEPILPEAGDYAISIDATPFFSYAKSLVGAGINATTPSWNFYTNNMTIWGKKFKDANTAHRAGIRIGFGSASKETLVADVTSTTTPQATVSDVVKTGGTNIGLTVGIEKRRGKTRLQGVYGAEFGINLSSTNTKNTYGNALTATNAGSRVATVKSGMGFGLGLRAFVGAEYFMFPKMSIGGEFGWGIAFMSQAQGNTTSERFDTSANVNAVVSTDVKTGKSSSFSLDTQGNQTVFGTNPGAALKLTLHF